LTFRGRFAKHHGSRGVARPFLLVFPNVRLATTFIFHTKAR